MAQNSASFRLWCRLSRLFPRTRAGLRTPAASRSTLWNLKPASLTLSSAKIQRAAKDDCWIFLAASRCPTEVNLRPGDPGRAIKKHGWKHMVTFARRGPEMVASDLTVMKKRGRI